MGQYNNLISWAMIMFAINILVVAGAMANDEGFRGEILTDLGEIFNTELSNSALVGNELGGRGITSENYDLEATQDLDNVENQNTDPNALQDFFDTFIDLAKFMGKVSGIIGFAIFTLIGTTGLLLASGASFPIWLYLVTVPLNLQTLRVVLRFFFPARLD